MMGLLFEYSKGFFVFKHKISHHPMNLMTVALKQYRCSKNKQYVSPRAQTFLTVLTLEDTDAGTHNK